MESFFNELSMVRDYRTENGKVPDLYMYLVQAYNCLNLIGIRTCRISGADLTGMIRLFQESGQRDAVNFAFAFFRQPYEGPALREVEDSYLQHEYEWKHCKCAGLAYAFLLDTVSVSLHDDPWNEFLIPLTVDSNEDAVAHNISGMEVKDQLLNWFEQIRPIDLISSRKKPVEKRIHLRDDHGKDVLHDFAEKLVESEYIEEIVNSIPFQPSQRTFIHKVCPDGMIEIVLSWTDEGFGLAVQTTGRNYRETSAIAEILKEKFGHK